MKIEIRKLTAAIAISAALTALVGGCGGGGGSASSPAAGTAKTGSGKVAAVVKFDAPASAREAATTASYTVSVDISISGVYSGDNKEFADVTASTDIDMTTGSAKVSVLNVPVGVNHLLTAAIDFGGYSSETLKAIIPAVTSDEVTAVTADHESTLVAEAAIYIASQKGKRLADLGADDIAAIEETVAYMIANGIPSYSATPEQVVSYMSGMGVPATVSLSPVSATVMAGGTYQFTASILDKNNIALSGATATWSFSASTVGTVNSSGLFTAVTAGTGVLTATYGTLSATAAVTVTSTCAADTDCGDGNALTLDACVNPGSSTSSCTHTAVACATSADCGGGAPVCVNGGTATAACVVCGSATDCNDNNSLTLDSCSNAGTASSACAHTAITCNVSMDCASPTAPVCINGGTVTSTCIACSTSSDCGGGAPYCANGGSIDSLCTACTSDTDCNDNDSATIDTCNMPNTASASCSHSTALVSDHISADTTWTLAGSPYIISGQIVIDPGVTLTIQPGVEVRFMYPASGTTLFDGFANGSGIRVSGTLHADGTSAAPILMKPDPGSPAGAAGVWTGIYIKDTTTQSTLSYISFDSPSTAIQIYDSLGGMTPPQISNITITNAGSPYTPPVPRRAGKKNNTKNSFHIFTADATGAWVERAVEHYALNFDERGISLGSITPADGEYEIRITQNGKRSAHMDSALLDVDGVTYAPISASEQNTGADMLRKVAVKDYDVVDVHNKTVVLKYALPAGISARRAYLRLTAREEGDEIVTSGRPFTYPPFAHADDVRTINYYRHTIGTGQGLNVDGQMTADDSLPAPAFTEYSTPNSGHPAGNVYGYAKSDSRYFYAALDFTTDNTYDFSADYATLYVRVGDNLKKFRVSVEQTRYGKVGFTYTRNVGYQHKYYEFKIPLSEIGNPKHGQTVQYMFDAYGTSSIFNAAFGIYGYSMNPMQINVSNVDISFNAADTGYMFGMYVSGATASQFLNINIANPPYGNYFSGGGGLSVDNFNVTNSKNTGITISGVTNSTFNNISSLDPNGVGLSMTSDTDVMVSNCSFGNTTYNPFEGAFVTYSTGITFKNCVFTNNGDGMKFYYANTAKITGVTVASSGFWGIHIDTYSNPTSCIAIYDSNITNSATQGVYSDNVASVYVNGVYLAGNAGTAPGTVELATTVPDSNSTNIQYAGVTSITGPLSTSFSGTPRTPSECF